MNRCFFPGSFDPFTFGHKNIIEKASAVSEHIIIGIGQHHEKKLSNRYSHKRVFVK